MANTKSAKKSIRKISYRTKINKSRRSRIRTFMKNFENFCYSKSLESSKILFKKLESEIMRSVNKGILHKNKASRTVSRMFKKLKSIS